MAKLLARYERFRQAKATPHREVVMFARRNGFPGRGAGWIDIHLPASAIAERIPCWTADPRLAALAGELGTAYELPGQAG